MKLKREENLKKSIECYASGKLDDALRYAEKILESHPNDLQIMTLMSIIKDAAGKTDESKELLKKVFKINPNYPEALYFSGIRAGKERDYKESMLLIQKAIEYQSEDAKTELSEYYQSLGSAFWKLNLRFDAFRAWDKALKLNPDQKLAEENLKKFANEYGLPKSPTKSFDDFYAFQSVKIEEYFENKNKSRFDNLDEANSVLKKIIEKWGFLIKKKDLSKLSTKKKINIYKEYKIDF